MKLQKHKAYIYQTETGAMIQHYKHTVNIPEEAIEKLGWKQGIELEPVVTEGKLILEPRGIQKPSNLVKNSRAERLMRMNKEDA